MYEILIKMNSGHVARLSHRDRTAWTLRTARKHLRGVVRSMVRGERPDYVHVSLARR